MDGQLSEHPLVELISEISGKKLSGALRVVREPVKAVVYFEQGALIFATSNLRTQRFSEYLRKHGFAAAANRQATSDVALAAALLTEGVLTRKQLDEILGEQVADVMRATLLWIDGSWNFDSRARLSESIQVKVPTQRLLLEAARRFDLKFTSSRLPNANELISLVSAPSNTPDLLPAEGFLWSRVEGSISVDDLIALSGQRELDAKQVIYGLVVAGLVHREFWPHAFREQQAQTVQKNPAVPIKAPSGPASQGPSVEKAEAAPDPRQELDRFLDRLALATNHYEVLDVPLSANLAEIKRMYHTMARNFHPDKFHELAGTATHVRLQSAFARITQAYETLANQELRATYDGNILALKRVRDTQAAALKKAGEAAKVSDSSAAAAEKGSDPEAAEKRFQEGAAALQLGQLNAAIAALSAAARMAPKEPKYRAYFGRALAAHPKTRRLAETELQTAVKLDPANASYHVMLAALYRDLGFLKRAEAELERALALDSANSQARQMLNALK